MILPLYASIERLGRSPREAAADLGAGPVAGFFRVTFPLTLPGVMAGCIFVFVPSLGNFIVPDLLGGGKKIMMGNLIQSSSSRLATGRSVRRSRCRCSRSRCSCCSCRRWMLNREKRLTARGA